MQTSSPTPVPAQGSEGVGRGGEPGDGDSDAASPHHRRRGELGPCVEHDVGADIGERRPLDRPSQHVQAKVEIVIAEGSGIVGHQVHGVDDWIGIARCYASEVLGERFALDHVSHIDEHHLIAVLQPQGIDGPGSPGESAGVGRIGQIVPRGRAAVDVGGGDDDDVRTVLRGRRHGGTQEHGG
ncbi:MAG: hypothetical protein V3R97_04115 [Gemmatimonadales bacterium]